jgi:stage IV sporulation protein B
VRLTYRYAAEATQAVEVSCEQAKERDTALSCLRKKVTGLIIVFLICLISYSAPFQSYAAFPNELKLFAGQSRTIDLAIPVYGEITVDNPDIAQVNGKSEHSYKVQLDQPVSVQSAHAGEAELQVKLFGKLPIKTVKVSVVPDLKVIPGGQTIGVKIQSDGILVVGHHLVQISADKKSSPGEQADVRLGDLIIKMNGQAIKEVSKVAEIVNQAGKSNEPIELVIRRDGKTFKTSVIPALDEKDQVYRLGVYIRDSAAGVGTLTFYAPGHHTYGALGHVITDMDTRTPIVPRGGEIVHSSVSSISKSLSGEPGEKRAHFFKEHLILGNIRKNTQFGIFGKMDRFPDYGNSNQAIPVAFASEVKEGPAEILTVVDGQKVERFKIEIVHAAKQPTPATKGLIIKITDPVLLERTGGIVQGMSGSPIIQDGKLVGAVTHVFVNDPASGYGCYMEWMLRDAGILIDGAPNQNNLKTG